MGVGETFESNKDIAAHEFVKRFVEESVLMKALFFCLSAQASISARGLESSLDPICTGAGRGVGKEVFMLILTGKNICQLCDPLLN